ncbi:DUF2752 domain-containing protein [Flavobacterium sp. M31R6]|uniref:DUF2752 domain-containing protein n=1 Tax=Flavobacterium sp. M31R6 TaxID=2739062 RepID=UPI0015690595|nr:DUF2752 domain-containing protein [Flavobacterium sp. M31R6]QKJ62138.1 DUF2752 domain-containing protein [Flavobacterium sp. M31R6]
MSKNKLYILILFACFLGYSWLLFLKLAPIKNSGLDLTVCVFKRVTSFPCPSCGTTRAVSYLFNGEIVKSLFLNPFGIVVAGILVVSPGWIVWDIVAKKQSFYNFYIKTEKLIRKKEIAIPLIVLVILNWVWNIYKHL